MIAEEIKPAIDSALASDITLREISDTEAQVYVPFYFPDGDGLVVHVRYSDGGYEVTDKAHTLLHLSYHTDVDRIRAEGTRSSLFERIRRRHDIDDRDGELVAVSDANRIGRTVFSFVQGLIEISDLRNLDRETVRSTFREDLDQLLADNFTQLHRAYLDARHDPQGEYPNPYLMNGTVRPLAIFDIGTDDAALRAIVIANQHRTWGRSDILFVAIEQDQEKLGRRNVSWLSNAFDKQFATLAGNEDAIVAYLEREWDISRRLSQRSA
jgi:hypothetical protein